MSEKMYHIALEYGQAGKYCILPGDPGRCEKIARYFDEPEFIAQNREYVTYSGTLLGEPVLVHKGTVDEVHVWARDVFREAIVRGAVGMLVAHNHPSGDVSPSLPDRALTAKLIEAGKVLDIILVNHLVVNGAGECASIKGWIFPGYKKLGFEEWE